MSDLSLLTVVPAAGAILYGLLVVLIRRRAPASAGVGQFGALLILLFCSSCLSVAWHSMAHGSLLADWALRLLTLTDLSIAPTMLIFAASRYRARFTPVAFRIAYVVYAYVGLVAVSGAMSRAILTPVPAPSGIDVVSAYGAVVVALATYIGSTAYLAHALVRERDPFERNRLKLITTASVLVVTGQLTNLVAALQQYPLDRSLALVASLLMFVSLIRYRLFDIDLAMKRVVVSGTALALVAPLYLYTLDRIGAATGATSSTWIALGMALLPPAAVGVHYARAGLQSVANRIFLGSSSQDSTAAAGFISRAQDIRTARALAELIATVCQRAFESRFASVLLLDSASGRLETSSTQGPFAAVQPGAIVQLPSEVQQLLVASRDPITPSRLRELLRPYPELEPEFSSLGTALLQPIVSHGELAGLIAVGEHVYDNPFSLQELRLLGTIGDQAALALERTTLLEQVQTHADTDFLTGLWNHRRMQDHLSRVMAEAESTAAAFSIAMIDVDNFKLLNDTYGHIAGDDALRRVAQFLTNGLRITDIVSRYGGDEFLVILPDTPRDQAAEILARIAREARRISLNAERANDSARIPMRLSWGTATYPESGTTARTLIAAADSDLLKRRYTRRRAGNLSGNQPALRALHEREPQQVRIASGLLELIDAKDPYTSEHSQQVASLGLLLAEQLELSEQDRQHLWLGGLLHDIGKLNVPADIVRKPGGLSEEEWAVVHRHPVDGERLILGLFGAGPLSEIVGAHHERYDGTGYPRGLKGDAIPRLARAVSVADSYSAMVHDRPYRKGLSAAEAVLELRRGAGSQWDPQMVEAFIKAMGRDDAAAETAALTRRLSA